MDNRAAGGSVTRRPPDRDSRSAPPKVTQQEEALARANTIRLAQAAFRREVAAMPRLEGMGVVAAALEDPDETTGAMRLGFVLAAPRRCSLGTAERLLGGVGVGSSDRRVRELTERQRKVLAVALRGPAVAGSGKREAA